MFGFQSDNSSFENVPWCIQAKERLLFFTNKVVLPNRFNSVLNNFSLGFLKFSEKIEQFRQHRTRD